MKSRPTCYDRLKWDHMNEQRIIIRRGGGINIIGGLILLSAGVVVLLALWSFSPRNALWCVLLTFPATIIVAGVWITFGRAFVIVDCKERTIQRRYACVVPLRSNLYQLDSYDSVRVASRREARPFHTATVHDVAVSDASGASVVIDTRDREADATILAKKIAECTGLQLR